MDERRVQSFLRLSHVGQHYKEVGWIDFPMDWSPKFRGYLLVPKGNPGRH